jgi:hypothetical protein
LLPCLWLKVHFVIDIALSGNFSSCRVFLPSLCFNVANHHSITRTDFWESDISGRMFAITDTTFALSGRRTRHFCTGTGEDITNNTQSLADNFIWCQDVRKKDEMVVPPT